MDEEGGRMSAPIPMRREPDRVTPWQSLKALAFILVLLGPGLPLTILLWRLAVGG